MSRNAHAAMGSSEARNEPLWRPNDYASLSGAFTYRDSATPTTDVAHEADPENVQPAQMHVEMSSYANLPQGYRAYVTRGNNRMTPGFSSGNGLPYGWGFSTKERAEIAAQAMMDRINKHGDIAPSTNRHEDGTKASTFFKD